MSRSAGNVLRSPLSFCTATVFKSPRVCPPHVSCLSTSRLVLSPPAGVTSTDTAQGTLCTPTKRPRDSGTASVLLPAALCDLPHVKPRPLSPASGSDSEATPEKRPRTDDKKGGSGEARGTPKQKNRRRCYRCQTKLELVQQELGSCRCGRCRRGLRTLLRLFGQPSANRGVFLCLSPQATCSACCTGCPSSTTACSTIWAAGARRPSSRW